MSRLLSGSSNTASMGTLSLRRGFHLEDTVVLQQEACMTYTVIRKKSRVAVLIYGMVDNNHGAYLFGGTTRETIVSILGLTT